MQTNKQCAEDDFDDAVLAFVEKLWKMPVESACPFCHDKNAMVHPLYDHDSGEVERLEDIVAYGVFCGTCGAGSKEGKTPEEAIENWNQRK
jgi:hypothetical protein